MTEDIATRSESLSIGSGAGREMFLALIWLGTSMWTAHATIAGDMDVASGALAAAAAALPAVIATTLLTGATIGHAAGARFRGAGGRLVAGLAVGVLFGLAAAAGIRFGFGTESSIMVLAVTVGVASVLGGATATLPDPVLEAGLWATTWVFFAGVIFGVLQTQVTTLLGGGITVDAAAQAAANTRFIYAQSIVTGLLAAYFALQKLRPRRHARLWYPVAGMLPGLLLLITEGLTRLGGTSLVSLVHGVSSADPILVELTDSARLRYALIVLGVGGIITMIAAVRTAGRSDD